MIILKETDIRTNKKKIHNSLDSKSIIQISTMTSLRTTIHNVLQNTITHKIQNIQQQQHKWHLSNKQPNTNLQDIKHQN